MRFADLAHLLAIPTLETDLQNVEAILDSATKGINPYLAVPARRVVGGGGKRLRPVVAIAAAATRGHLADARVLRAAAALELVHVGSLVHDDIIDDAKTRRGVTTVNASEGSKLAILVGDYLLSSAGKLAASVSREVSHSLACAIADLCEGQSLEMADAFNPHRTQTAYLESIGGKTAALLREACRIGALAADMSTTEVAALASFGESFGMAFQIIDDVLDLTASADGLGKPVGNDMREGVYTLPLLLLLDADPALKEYLRPDSTTADFESLVLEMNSKGTIVHALRLAQQYNDKAQSSLTSFDSSPMVEGFRQLPNSYLRWVLEEKAPSVLQSSQFEAFREDVLPANTVDYKPTSLPRAET